MKIWQVIINFNVSIYHCFKLVLNEHILYICIAWNYMKTYNRKLKKGLVKNVTW